jgi:hypothetical protein
MLIVLLLALAFYLAAWSRPIAACAASAREFYRIVRQRDTAA